MKECCRFLLLWATVDAQDDTAIFSLALCVLLVLIFLLGKLTEYWRAQVEKDAHLRRTIEELESEMARGRHSLETQTQLLEELQVQLADVKERERAVREEVEAVRAEQALRVKRESDQKAMLEELAREEQVHRAREAEQVRSICIHRRRSV